MNNFKTISRGAAVCAAILALGVAGCGSSSDTANSGLSGKIAIDGSSTVYPFAQAAAEQFNGESPNVQITVGESGTGGGFEKFCAGETDISNASRPIDPDEVKICEKNGIKYTEVQVADDGIAIVTNPDLKVKCLTTDQLKQVWEKGSKVNELSSLASDLPSGKLSLYGPGTDSGTFDYFTEAINGEKGNTRSDYQPSEDDNVLVQGVSGDKGGLGYFGFSYFESNQDKLNLVAVDGGDGCVTPSIETIQSGTYKPLSRPLFMYIKQDSLAKPDVKAFITYTLDNNEAIATSAKIVPMSAENTTKAKQAIS
ncbi:MAG: PstS family phosphate ABC transporter substrate-binding protein [Thermoleophilaceae bacterium]|nr:PstS family phosphate ABC transporter substrate-binding protein [Thermoleophilaceae bacterium]